MELAHHYIASGRVYPEGRDVSFWVYTLPNSSKWSFLQLEASFNKEKVCFNAVLAEDGALRLFVENDVWVYDKLGKASKGK